VALLGPRCPPRVAGALPCPEGNDMYLCDASARESEPATRVVYVPNGQIWLCESHYQRDEAIFAILGYLVVPVIPAEET
jgi:hypothetical protein